MRVGLRTGELFLRRKRSWGLVSVLGLLLKPITELRYRNGRLMGSMLREVSHEPLPGGKTPPGQTLTISDIGTQNYK